MDAFPILPPGTPLVDIHNTFGAAYIGSLASMGLLGATVLQAWFYYNSFPEDPKWIKLMVFCVVAIEFIRSTFTAHAVYYYLVLNWGNVLGLQGIVWSLSSIVITTNIGELFGHLYFAWRIYMFSVGWMRPVLTGLVVVLTFWNFGMGTATFVNLAQATNINDYTGGAQTVLAPFALATAIATDVAIAACLVFLLSRTRTGFSRTNRIINLLMFYAIQVGAITVLADVAVIILNHYIDRVGFAYIGVYAVIGNLYANSLLASLNARTALKSNLSTVLSSMQAATGRSHSTGQSSTIRSAGSPKITPNDRAIHLQTFESATGAAEAYAYRPSEEVKGAPPYGPDSRRGSENPVSKSEDINPAPQFPGFESCRFYAQGRCNKGETRPFWHPSSLRPTIESIVTSFESCVVLVHNLPASTSHSRLIALVERCGDLKTCILTPARDTHSRGSARIEYLNAFDASRAAAEIVDIAEPCHPTARLDLRARESGKAVLQSTKVKLSRYAPTRIAWTHYSSIARAKTEAARINGEPFDGHPVRASFQTPTRNQTRNFPVEINLDADAPHIQRFSQRRLHDLLARAGPLESFEPIEPSPQAHKKPSAKLVAFAQFADPAAAARAVANLHGTQQPFLRNSQVFLEPVHAVKYALPPAQYVALRAELDAPGAQHATHRARRSRACPCARTVPTRVRCQ
ncbi:uncharacterized protein BXZ73DRAFT_100434 [Epithele typhae]|uniref:uncharacterized protein n=1 Tax=Epithele typhae TaxID=378194 RepID=UPI00200825FA|nr:uncharacterized protein BXZ73DRAFT_100434 [Epithele typhae]KAH9935962.1 hypothetical protein BXZ73DRAFT_100434 [Epithele typhae]